MKWGLKGGISIDADSGSVCQQLFAFIQICYGHTVPPAPPPPLLPSLL
jgi:hypothetical protein